MARRITVVMSQGQSANPAKRKLEEDLVGALLFERGIEVTVIPHLYDLPPGGTGMLCLHGINGDMVVLSWLYPRAAHWTLDRNGIRGRMGQTLLVGESAEDDDNDDDEADESGRAEGVSDSRSIPDRTIWCLDLRARPEPAPFVEEIRRIVAEATVATVGVDLMSWIKGSPKPEQLERYLNPGGAGSAAMERVPSDYGTNGDTISPSNSAADAVASLPPATPSDSAGAPIAQPVRIDEPTARRWYPVIDYSRCTNCLECLDFCLFGVYGVGGAETILVEQPDNCRKGCPACSRVCPENAIIFPQHKTAAIAGSPDGAAGGLKIDLSKLFGAPDALEVAVLERDVELVAVGRDAVGMAVGIPKRQDGKEQGAKDELDSLMDELDGLEL